MFDNKTLKVQSAREMLFLRLKCVCVCVCVFARACVCVCAARSKTDKQSTLWVSGASKRSNTHTICKNRRLGEYSLKTVHVLKWTRTVGRKLCVNILSQWQIGASSMLIKEQNTKTKLLTALNLNKVIALISINLSITYSENYAVFIYIWSLLDLFCSYYLSEH